MRMSAPSSTAPVAPVAATAPVRAHLARLMQVVLRTVPVSLRAWLATVLLLMTANVVTGYLIAARAGSHPEADTPLYTLLYQRLPPPLGGVVILLSTCLGCWCVAWIARTRVWPPAFAKMLCIILVVVVLHSLFDDALSLGWIQ